MPTYEYKCTHCGNHFDKRQRIDDAPLSECIFCGGPVQRVIAPVGVIFKGSGFYVTDNKSANRRNGSSADASKKTESTTESTSEKAKPEDKSTKADTSA